LSFERQLARTTKDWSRSFVVMSKALQSALHAMTGSLVCLGSQAEMLR